MDVKLMMMMMMMMMSDSAILPATNPDRHYNISAKFPLVFQLTCCYFHRFDSPQFINPRCVWCNQI